MKIRVEADGHRFTIPFPTGLFLNRITCHILAGCLKRYTEFPLTEMQIYALSIELKRAKKTLANLPLIDVVSNDGQKVKITL
jgi:hypothetical protein